jgi:proprotein convertase subtilisin/kexin type 5
MEVTIHEIIHALGFSGSAIIYWINPSTGKPYGTDGRSKITATTTVRKF